MFPCILKQHDMSRILSGVNKLCHSLIMNTFSHSLTAVNVDISKSYFSLKCRYLKVNFLEPKKNYFEIPVVHDNRNISWARALSTSSRCRWGYFFFFLFFFSRLSYLFFSISVRDYKYLSCVYGVDRKICHEGH